MPPTLLPVVLLLAGCAPFPYADTADDTADDTGDGTTNDTGSLTDGPPAIVITSPASGASLAAVDGTWGLVATVQFAASGCVVGDDCVVFAHVNGVQAYAPDGDRVVHEGTGPIQLLLPDYGTWDIGLDLRDDWSWDPISDADTVRVTISAPSVSGTVEPFECREPTRPHAVALEDNGLFTIGLEDDANGWASGPAGTLRLQDGVWSEPASPQMRALELTGGGKGWGATWYDGIQRLSDGRWTRFDPGFDATVYGAYSIDMVDDANGFISTHQGTVLHLDHGVWKKVVLNTHEMRRVRAWDADHAWLTSTDSSWRQHLWVYDSGTWTEYAGDPPDVLDVAFTGAGSGYAVGWNNRIHAVSSGVVNATSAVAPPYACEYEALFTLDLWDASNGWSAGGDGCAWRLSGGTWSQQTCYDCDDIHDLELTGPNRGWGVTHDQMGTFDGGLVRLENGVLSPVELPQWPSGDLFAGDLFTDDVGWIASGETLYRRHGGDWEQYVQIGDWSPTFGDTIEKMAFTSPYSGWVTTNDDVFEVAEGYAFAVLPPLNTTNVNGLDLHGAAGVLVGGNSGIPPVGDVFELNSAGQWVKSSFSASLELEEVDLVDENDGWAVGGGGFLGAKGNVVRINDGVWSEVSATVGAPLFDVALVDEQNGWAVGGTLQSLEPTHGTPFLYRLKNGVWSQVPVAADTVLLAVDVRADGTGWAVGLNGFVVALSPTGASPCEAAKLSDDHLRDVVISPETGRALILGDAGTAFWL